MAASGQMSLTASVKASRQKSKASFFGIQKLDCCQRVPPTFRVSLSALNNQIKKIPHRDSRQLVF